MEINIEEYLERTIDPDDKTILKEALECAKNDNLRAAYIMFWVSVAESLKRKITFLAGSGEAKAIAALSEIETAENESRSVDNTIIGQSMSCNIIDNSEQVELQYLWKKRSIFAHPYQSRPSEDDIKHCVSKVMSISVGKPLNYTLAGIKAQIDTIVTQPHIMEFDHGAIESYIQRFVDRIEQINYNKTYIYAQGKFNSWKGLGNESQWTAFKIRTIIIKLLSKSEVDFENPSWFIEKSVENFPYETWVTSVGPETWMKFSAARQKQLLNFLKYSNFKNKKFRHYRLFASLLKSRVLDMPAKNRILEFFEEIPAVSILPHYPELRERCQRIAKELGEYDYSIQNDILRYLTDNELPWLKEIELEGGALIANGIRRCIDAKNSNAFDYLKRLIKKFENEKLDIKVELLKVWFLSGSGKIFSMLSADFPFAAFSNMEIYQKKSFKDSLKLSISNSDPDVPFGEKNMIDKFINTDLSQFNIQGDDLIFWKELSDKIERKD